MQMYFNPIDDSQLFAVYQSRAVLWNIATGKQQTLNNDHATIMQAAFDPKGQFIVTAANDGTVRLFRTQRGGRLGTRRIARASRSGLRDRRCPGRNDRLRVGRRIRAVLASGAGGLSIATRKFRDRRSRKAQEFCRSKSAVSRLWIGAYRVARANLVLAHGRLWQEMHSEVCSGCGASPHSRPRKSTISAAIMSKLSPPVRE